MDGRWSIGPEAEIWRTGLLLDVFLLLFLLFFGSGPGSNDVGTGFYHLPLEVEFTGVPDPPKGRHCAILIGCGTYGFVRLRA